MGILNKLTFWKKDDLIPGPSDMGAQDIDLGDTTGLNSPTGYSPNKDGLGGNVGLNNPTGYSPNQTGLSNSLNNPNGNNFGNTGMDGAGFNAESGNPSLSSKFEPVEEKPSSFNNINQNMMPPEDLSTLSKNIEIISSKVDTIKAILDNLSHKIDKIEKIAEAEDEGQKGSRW